jgi:hypothetical protein
VNYIDKVGREQRLLLGTVENRKKYRVSTMKRPDFGEFLKIGKWFFSGLKGLLHTTGVHIPA